MNPKWLFFSFFLLLPPLMYGQVAPSKYRITFTDKANTPFTTTNPEVFLSQKSIDRRLNQGIPISDDDLPVDPAYVNAVLGYGFQLLNRSRWFNCITVYTQDSTLPDSIKTLPFVLGIDTLGKVKPKWYDQAGYKHVAGKWELEHIGPPDIITGVLNNYGQGYDQIAMLGGNILHGIGYRGAGVTIAILDAGFSGADNNPAFAHIFDSGRLLGTWDFVDGNSPVYDNGQHGLWVFSIIGADIPGTLVGVAPEASFYLFRTEDTNSEYLIEEDNWVSAAEYADSAGADILTTSLGYSTFSDPAMDHTYADLNGNTTRITRGADKAAGKGMLVVNAAGNAGSSSWQYILAPADGDSVLAVGSVDAAKSYSSFSSKGPSADGRMKPNVAAMGEGATTITSSGSTQTGNGTSFAAPLIAGMAACLWQAHPGASNMDLFEAIEKSGDQYTAPGYLQGYGVPNFMTAHYLLSGLPPTNDEDGDGVPDVSDQCFLTPASCVVDEDGCPVNFDVDAFLDRIENPVTGTISPVYYAAADEEIYLALYDMSGRKMLENAVELTAGGYSRISPGVADALARGIYLLTVRSGGAERSRLLLFYRK